VRSWRLLASRVFVNEVELLVTYADVFVVQREGDAWPGPNDWEATLRTAAHHHLAPGTYALGVELPDDTTLAGRALLRFSDGTRHLFRGDGDLAGFEP
jgi:hypothetical protein